MVSNISKRLFVYNTALCFVGIIPTPLSTIFNLPDDANKDGVPAPAAKPINPQADGLSRKQRYYTCGILFIISN